MTARQARRPGAESRPCLPLCAPPPRPPPRPRLALLAPSRPGPRRNTTRRRLHLPGRRYYGQPADPYLPDEDRRLPSFLLSIFPSSCWSHSCRRCHLKTPQAWGREGEGRKTVWKMRLRLRNSRLLPSGRKLLPRPLLPRKSLPGTSFLCQLLRYPQGLLRAHFRDLCHSGKAKLGVRFLARTFTGFAGWKIIYTH